MSAATARTRSAYTVSVGIRWRASLISSPYLDQLRKHLSCGPALARVDASVLKYATRTRKWTRPKRYR